MPPAGNKIYAIILAAGNSERFGKNKLNEILDQQTPVLQYTVNKFLQLKTVDQIIIVGNSKTLSERKINYVKGGKTRQESSFSGLQFIGQNFKIKPTDIVIFHNAANPLVTEKEIMASIKSAQKYGAAIVAQPVSDTVKEIKNGKISRTLARGNLYLAQTPQTFQWQIVEQAHKNAVKNKIFATDEAMLVEEIGYPVKIIPASPYNRKITFQADLDWAKHILGSQNVKVGIGQDSHEFDKTKKGLTLAGITFKEHWAFQANSDGDVILHSLCNALLSGIGQRSFSFIANPMNEKGIKDSKKYLAKVLIEIEKQQFEINNVAISLEGSYPKFEPIIPKLKKSLAKLLNINETEIGITATSGEKLTSFGKGQGIQSVAVVSLKNAI